MIQYAESACPHGPRHSKAKYSGMLTERLQAHLRGRTRQWHLHRMCHSHTPLFLPGIRAGGGQQKVKDLSIYQSRSAGNTQAAQTAKDTGWLDSDQILIRVFGYPFP